ncbi:hypothetical protein Taro_038779 [Colocasia esculenta]|uniref:Reverse transcriptase n=1 Tax=Colocasia esculenta TaxID=4460 RepID=A0A843WET7_COLES|nr:hypothetical protein [Colocasia esculenta]
MPHMAIFLLELLEEVIGLKVNFNKSVLIGRNLHENLLVGLRLASSNYHIWDFLLSRVLLGLKYQDLFRWHP